MEVIIYEYKSLKLVYFIFVTAELYYSLQSSAWYIAEEDVCLKHVLKEDLRTTDS